MEEPPWDIGFPPSEPEDHELLDWGSSYRKHKAREDARRKSMINENQSQLLEKAEEVLRGLEEEENGMRAEDEDYDRLMTDAWAWEAASSEEMEREEQELAEVSQLASVMRVFEAAPVAGNSESFASSEAPALAPLGAMPPHWP